MAPFLGFGGHGRVALPPPPPLDPPVPWVENCLNARGCLYVHFKAKLRVFAVSFIY